MENNTRIYTFDLKNAYTSVVVRDGKVWRIEVHDGQCTRGYSPSEYRELLSSDRRLTDEVLHECELAQPDIFRNFIPRDIVVHGGLFHMDDVLCAVLCRIANPAVRIARKNNPETEIEIADIDLGIIVADVGGVYDPERGLFDHHQDKYTAESDPATVRAAVGRLWDTLGNVENYPGLTAFIHAVDLHDTGVSWTPLGVLGAFAPNWDETGATMDDGFEAAVQYLLPLVRRLILKDEADRRAVEAVAACQREDGVIIMEKFLPWQEYAAQHEEIRAVVFPGRDPGTWNISIPKGRGLFPASWLEPANKPDGMVFMPAWRTMCVANSPDKAKEFATHIVAN